jgi:hypothetical protein
VRIVQELGERATKYETLQAEVSLYREAFVLLSTRRAVEVPGFVRQESGGLSEGETTRVDAVRQWLEAVLSEETAAGEGTVPTTRAQSRSHTRGKGVRPSTRGRQRPGGTEGDDVA